MRRILLLPLALSAAFTAGACRTGADDDQQTAFQVPKRDLTLQQANVPQVEVASPIELARAAPTRHQSASQQQIQRRPVRTRHAAPKAEPSTMDAVVTTPAAAAATPVSQAVYEAPDPHALAPGQTVTVLPASSSGGSTSNPGSTDRGPPDAQPGERRGPEVWTSGEGGNCGRHPGSGGRPAPAIDFR